MAEGVLILNPPPIPQEAAYNEALVAQLTPKIHIQFTYNNNPRQVTEVLSGVGAATNNEGLAILSTGASVSSSALLESNDILKYNSGLGGVARLVASFSPGVVGSIQRIGLGTPQTNAYTIGFDGADFGVFRIRDAVTNPTLQANFNLDKLDGVDASQMLLDPTKLNVYQIRYQWVGHITFEILNPVTGRFFPFHRIEYANNNTELPVLNPTFIVGGGVRNDTNATDVVMNIASMSAFIEGIEEDIGIVQSVRNSRLGVTSQINILTIRNKATFQGQDNLVRLVLTFLSVSNDGNKAVEYKLVKDTTLGGVPVFNDVDTNSSVVEFDIDGTTLTGGNELVPFETAKNSSDKFSLETLEITLNPGETLTISAESAQAADVNVGLIWKELF